MVWKTIGLNMDLDKLIRFMARDAELSIPFAGCGVAREFGTCGAQRHIGA